jgi:UDP-sugar pyrophosphorylase
MATETLYLKYYIQYILAAQKKYAPEGKKLPLCIMTSGDTNERTVKLLEKHKYFGMDKDQITIVIQGKGVPALLDNHAKIATDPNSPTSILTKPHGHGDIHALLYSNSVAKKWLADGVKWMVLFQDTNGLAFHTLPLMLGVSTKLDLIMNSLAVPRKAKQAIGGIAKLTNKESGENK